MNVCERYALSVVVYVLNVCTSDLVNHVQLVFLRACVRACVCVCVCVRACVRACVLRVCDYPDTHLLLYS